MGKLKVTIVFEIDANLNDEEEVREEIEYSLQSAMDNEELSYEVEEIDNEEEYPWV